ncbi:Glutamine amidotransferase, class-II [Trichormus variabilis ATCC 29413]|uniref:Glutamine amidotransferase, class-II n=2 Tax=Anabaena variabilis TaxID=264691 RepID=Q3M3W9_TRIV2|nr:MULTISPECIES: class II glutamine amidotransferase [Nostocaceae]ABA24317.1 Glutamine amidotransferase, class-II [Trichormus variabilis ATCC 29413]MBC1215000.1 class II glutamine amidotransferase [Trichormus variabilis ARAD]MBC1254079.1 class II glutamine amidotransferase [Trichormus variabilis V5]MBC1268067.1 class II glutamine amidotransferase [Trichormus variabilis FSR]MBC1301921.1 class II glutamine amidotransferase [Trichormus variabilis N2B]
MCQLLGMNCNVPTDICFSFEGFSARGGKTDHHSDGWGIAFFEGKGCRIFLDAKPSIDSPIADFVRCYPIHSTHVIAHIRKATQGEVALENCHPFRRELWGRYWVFAHNGNLPDFQPPIQSFYQAVGHTDSEKAFCLILETLRQSFPEGKPSLEKLYPVLQQVTKTLAAIGVFNYLLSDGEHFFTHCSTNLSYIVRQAPFAAAHLIDQDMTVDFNELTTPSDRVAVIATTPLTDNEVWTPIQPGELLVFQDGLPLRHIFN